MNFNKPPMPDELVPQLGLEHFKINSVEYRYINQKGQEVDLDEYHARNEHFRHKEFLGRTDGLGHLTEDKTPPPNPYPAVGRRIIKTLANRDKTLPGWKHA